MEPKLLAGAARVSLTRDPATRNWVGGKPYGGVLDPLYARVVVLSDGCARAALVCWDLIDAAEEAVAEVRRAIHGAVGLPETHILVNASHSHSAPRSPFLPETAGLEYGDMGRAVLEDPAYRAWAEGVPGACARAAEVATASMQPVTLAIGRANAAEWLFNRRPRRPDGRVTTLFVPEDPCAIPGELRSGPMDPTLTALCLRSAQGETVATLFHLPCHGVSVYGEYGGVSADWPGPTAAHVTSALGGEALFLQGCCGDIVPARRGLAARDRMARFVADRVVAACARSSTLPSGPLCMRRAVVGLPLSEAGRQRCGQPMKPAEVSTLTCGPLGLVALPGEPLVEVAMAIQRRSPFPHTLVLGYTDGRGVGYVGMPGERARGGYESEASLGADECGAILVEVAARLLGEALGTG